MKRSVEKRAASWTYGIASLSAILAVVWLAGCITPPTGLEMVRGIEQNDIYVPKDFEFQPKESEAFDVPTVEEAKFRHWTGYYRGPGKYNSLLPLYVKEMPKLGWTFKEMTGATQEKRLRFEKGDEEATIEIHRELDSKVGGFTNVICAKIRQRGTEDFTVEENLVNTKDARLRPASYTAKSVERTERTGPPSESGGAPLTPKAEAKGNRDKKGEADSPVPQEIEEFERTQ